MIEDAVRDAKRNAEEKGVNNVQFITGEAETVIPQMYDNGIRADVMAVNPSRKGCDERLLKKLWTCSLYHRCVSMGTYRWYIFA